MHDLKICFDIENEDLFLLLLFSFMTLEKRIYISRLSRQMKKYFVRIHPRQIMIYQATFSQIFKKNTNTVKNGAYTTIKNIS